MTAALNLDGVVKSLLALLDALLGLEAHDATTPLLASILVLLKVTLLDGGDELGELALVLRADLGEGEDGSGLFDGMLIKWSKLVPEVRNKKVRTFLWTTVPSLALPLMMA